MKTKSRGKITLQHRLEYFFYVALEKFVCALPEHALQQVAKNLAILVFFIFRIRRGVALQNLSLAFPQKQMAWRRKIAFRSYWHFALVILELMKMNVWSLKFIERKVETENEAEVLERFREGKGVILLTAHFGIWEILLGYLSKFGLKTAVIQQRQKNRLIDERMKRLRQIWGGEIVYPRGAVQKCVQALGDGKNVTLLADQDAGKKGIFVPFFGVPASTHAGVALIHLKSGAPVFFPACVRQNSGSFKVTLHKISDFGKSKITEEKITRIIADYIKLLESYVRKYPEQYFWMHRRWKSSPPAQNDLPEDSQ